MTDSELIAGVIGFIALVLLLITIKYVDLYPDELVLGVNKCIREVNKNYISPGKGSDYIYRIEKIKNDFYYITNYSNRNWISLGPKSMKYFMEGEVFRFENIVCPEKVKSAKLGERLKDFEFHL